MADKWKKGKESPILVLAEKGEVRETTNEKQFEWKINKFLCLSEEVYKCYSSPSFSFNSELWYLQITDANKFYSITLCREPDDSPITVGFSLAIKTVSGEDDLQTYYTAVFEKERSPRQPLWFIPRSELVRRSSELLHCGVLTVVCSLKILKSTEIANNSIAGKCFYCQENLGAEFISLHETCLDRPIKCGDCSDVAQLQNCLHDHEYQNERRKEDESLSEDFKKMLLDGRNHDLVLKIGEEEFRAHKDVLIARSPVFRSMLTLDKTEKNSRVIDVPDCDLQAMNAVSKAKSRHAQSRIAKSRAFRSMVTNDRAEKNTSVIDVSDCDPQAISAFLSYVYSGKVEPLDHTNMLGLYYMADKYEMINLKNECCSFIKSCLSPTNFCEVIQLALSHSDLSLLEFATEYFISNMIDILCTVEWQCFLKNNSTVANELFIKSCHRKK